MNRKLKSLMLQLLQSPKRFPFEFALGIVFFIIAVWDLQLSTSNMSATRVESTVNGDILWLFAPLMVLTFWLHRVNHLAYIRLRLMLCMWSLRCSSAYSLPSFSI